MADSWSIVFKETIGNREVTGKRYDEGGYKVITTQKNDDDGSVAGDQKSTVIIPPSSAGTTIEIDAENLGELKAHLVEDEEFTPEEADEIVSKFGT